MEGTCTVCGWSVTTAIHLRPCRSLLEPSPSAASACWFLLPLAAAVANVFAPVLSIGVDASFGAMVTTGIAAAEFGLLAIIAALGPGRPAARLAMTFTAAVVLLFLLMVGVTAGVGIGPAGRPLRQAAGYFLVLPALLLSAQGPLWIFRVVAGRRMRSNAGQVDRRTSLKTQFGVAQLLWTTALIAVCIALARGAFVLWAADRGEALAELWSRGAAVCAMVAIGSTFVAIPSATLLMARSAGGAAILILVYAAMLTIALLGIMKVAAAPGRAPATLEFAAAFGFMVLTTFGGILAGLAVIRSGGYTMFRD